MAERGYLVIFFVCRQKYQLGMTGAVEGRRGGFALLLFLF
jgi:hypothetical protein